MHRYLAETNATNAALPRATCFQHAAGKPTSARPCRVQGFWNYTEYLESLYQEHQAPTNSDLKSTGFRAIYPKILTIQVTNLA